MAHNQAAVERRRIYQDLVRVGERALEFQVRIVLDRFDRTDRLIRLGVATIAGMVAVLGILLTRGFQMGMAGSIGIGGSIVMAMVSIYLLVRLNTAFHREGSLDLGPDTGDVLKFVESEEVDQSEYAGHMAHEIPRHVEANADMIHAISYRQGRAIVMLIVGVILHLATIAYISGGVIHG